MADSGSKPGLPGTTAIKPNATTLSGQLICALQLPGLDPLLPLNLGTVTNRAMLRIGRLQDSRLMNSVRPFVMLEEDKRISNRVACRLDTQV